MNSTVYVVLYLEIDCNFEVEDCYIDMGISSCQCICTQTIKHGHLLKSNKSNVCVIIGGKCAERVQAGLLSECNKAKRKKCTKCSNTVENMRGNKAKADGGPYCEACWKKITYPHLNPICSCGKKKEKLYSEVYKDECFECMYSSIPGI